ncbi:MAG: glycosyltransferase family 4 protein [archaeon]
MIKKICFFSTSFAMHKQVRLKYAERYLPKDIQIFLLTPAAHNKYKLKRAEVIEISGSKINFVLELRRFCKKNRIDLLTNLGTINESFGMVFATFGLKTKYIINFIGNIWDITKLQNKSKNLFLFIKKIFLAIPFIFAKKIIQPSPDLADKTKKYYPFTKSRVFHTPLIVDEKLFSPKDKASARKKLKLPIKKDIILSVGRVSYLKGSDILIELAKKNPDKLFIIVGEIIDKTYEKERLPNLVLIHSVKGKELADYYNSADLFIFPSRIEAYGMVHREAMSCETPSLISDIPALGLTEHALKSKPNAEEMQIQLDKFFSMSEKERKKLGKISRGYILKENSYNSLKEIHKELLLS